MTETKQLYEQMPEEESAYKPLKELIQDLRKSSEEKK